MNVNRIDSEAIKAQAQNLLQNKAKVDLGKDDLEVLWQNAKLTGDSTLFENVSDEDGLAMFDLLDNKGNNAETSYKLLMNWLKDQEGVVPKKAEEASVPVATTQASAEPATAELFSVSNEQLAGGVDSQLNTLSAENQVSLQATDVSTDAQRTFDRLLPNQTKTIDVNGKSYTLANASKTANNFAYYIEGGKLVIEGSDLKLTAADNADVNDDVKMMGNRNTIDMGVGNDIVEVEGDMNMVYGGSGNDHIKLRGDYNTTDMSAGDDIVWIAGDNNVAHGQGGNDNFFAAGDKNTFMDMGKPGVDTDASYFRGVDQAEFGIENKITDATDFEKWVKGDDGPPYVNPPEALDGHEVRAYDDNTYTDKYEEEPLYHTEYRDIAYRELGAKTTENKVTGEATVVRYNEDKTESYSVTFAADGSVTVKENGETKVFGNVSYVDQDGKVVSNPGSLSDILEKLATGKWTVDGKPVSSVDPNPVDPTPVDPEPVDPTPVDPEPVDPNPVVPDDPEPNVPETPLPTANEVATLTNDFNASIADALQKAGDEYFAAMSNKNADGTFNTSDDAAASQKYAATVDKLNVKKNTVINTGMPLVRSASISYANASDKTDEYYTKLYELVMKTLEANRKYFENQDEDSEADLKAEAEQANAELQKYLK